MVPLVYHPDYSFAFPRDHRFTMSKFKLTYENLVRKGLVHNNLFTPEKPEIEQFHLAHDPGYVKALCKNTLDEKAWRRIGLPFSEQLIHRTLIAPAGTLLASKLALEHGVACHIGGGTHHAHYSFGSGFCLLNDLAFSSLALNQMKPDLKILIFDLDVHQGDGTASILKNEKNIYTVSVHCEKNFPYRKETSTVDVGLHAGMSDDEYLTIVESTLNESISRFSPDIVLYDAGVDIWEHDKLGLLNISWQGIFERDKLVFEKCKQAGIPIASVIGGGYDPDEDELARRHSIVFEVANSVFNVL